MSKQIVNLTQLMVKKGIDLILPTCPRDYQLAFQDPDLRNKLILYVLRQIPNSYIAVDPDQQASLHNKVLLLSFKQQRQIKSLLHEGIHRLLVLDAIQFNPDLPDPAPPNPAPQQIA